MAVGVGIPAIASHFGEQPNKGRRWRDIGLGDWLSDLDNEEEHVGIVAGVLPLAKHRAAAKAKAVPARAVVGQRLRETMAVGRKHLPA